MGGNSKLWYLIRLFWIYCCRDGIRLFYYFVFWNTLYAYAFWLYCRFGYYLPMAKIYNRFWWVDQYRWGNNNALHPYPSCRHFVLQVRDHLYFNR